MQNISIMGQIIRDTPHIYLDPRGMLSNNLFTRLDGNASSIHSYARNIRLNNNESVWNGDSEGIPPILMGYDGAGCIFCSIFIVFFHSFFFIVFFLISFFVDSSRLERFS